MSAEVSLKKVAVAVGPGFSVDKAPLRVLQTLGYEVQTFGLEQGQRTLPDFVLRQAGLILFRGPWRPSPEESLLVKILGAQLPERWQPQQRVIGFGRGAWLLMDRYLPRMVWQEAFEDTGTWLESRVEGDTTTFFSLLQGRVLPQMVASKEFNPQPWVRAGETVCGWKISPNMKICFTDPLSFSHRSQLRSFGYDNLADVQELNQLMERLLRHD